LQEKFQKENLSTFSKIIFVLEKEDPINPWAGRAAWWAAKRIFRRRRRGGRRFRIRFGRRRRRSHRRG